MGIRRLEAGFDMEALWKNVYGNAKQLAEGFVGKISEKLEDSEEKFEEFVEDFINMVTVSNKKILLNAIEPPVMNLLSGILQFLKRSVSLSVSSIPGSLIVVEGMFKALEGMSWGWIQSTIDHITNTVSKLLSGFVSQVVNTKGLENAMTSGLEAMSKAAEGKNRKSLAYKMHKLSKEIEKKKDPEEDGWIDYQELMVI